MRLAQLIAETRAMLGERPDSALDARVLVENLTGTSRTDAIARADTEISAEAVQAVRAAATRRQRGEPVHRILGFREFHGLTLHLSPDTLEPRPDTEALVDVVLPHLQAICLRTGAGRLLDLGTGTGAIALALLAQVPQARGIGIDISPGALETARRNADVNGVADRFETKVSDWFGGVEGVFDVIVSNPPYIESEAIGELDVEVREYDPIAALDGGPDGLEPYRIIAAGAGAHLAPRGIVAVEIGIGQGASVVEMFRENGYRLLESADDLAGTQRALVFAAGAD